MKVEQITPYGGEAVKSQQVREMFDNIAPAYDFMNRAMTFGVDKWWRKVAVNIVARHNPSTVLDLATGTGDLAIALAHRLPHALITGADLSQGMLDIAREKIEKRKLSSRITLTVADGTALPFADASFNCVTIAYGIRNFEDIVKGYSEMYRVLRPGGLLVIVELSTPANPVALAGYKLYTRFIIPAAGRLVSKDCRAYSYLPESIAAVPQRHNMTALLFKAGFNEVQFETLTFGTCCIYTAVKPTDT